MISSTQPAGLVYGILALRAEKPRQFGTCIVKTRGRIWAYMTTLKIDGHI